MAKLANNSSTTTTRKSYLLSVTPVQYSLTEGTSIPAPDSTPPRSPLDVAPPTPGRGPLNSHPTSEFDEPEEMTLDKQSTKERESVDGVPAARMMSSDGASSFRTQDAYSSPNSATNHHATAPSSSSPQPRRPSGVRKLLSLSSLRNSFASSRTSLALPRSSNDTYNSPQPTHNTANGTYSSSLKRPSSPSMISTTASTVEPASQHPMPPPPLRSKKSGGNWFKRKSSMFMLNGNGDLDSVAEDSGRPETRESKRVKPSTDGEAGVYGRVPVAALERKASPPPLIPEIGRGSFSGGDLGWDEASFRR